LPRRFFHHGPGIAGLAGTGEPGHKYVVALVVDFQAEFHGPHSPLLSYDVGEWFQVFGRAEGKHGWVAGLTQLGGGKFMQHGAASFMSKFRNANKNIVYILNQLFFLWYFYGIYSG
jgi:hypothetical protein